MIPSRSLPSAPPTFRAPCRRPLAAPCAFFVVACLPCLLCCLDPCVLSSAAARGAWAPSAGLAAGKSAAACLPLLRAKDSYPLLLRIPPPLCTAHSLHQHFHPLVQTPSPHFHTSASVSCPAATPLAAPSPTDDSPSRPLLACLHSLFSTLRLLHSPCERSREGRCGLRRRRPQRRSRRRRQSLRFQAGPRCLPCGDWGDHVQHEAAVTVYQTHKMPAAAVAAARQRAAQRAALESGGCEEAVQPCHARSLVQPQSARRAPLSASPCPVVVNEIHALRAAAGVFSKTLLHRPAADRRVRQQYWRSSSVSRNNDCTRPWKSAAQAPFSAAVGVGGRHFSAGVLRGTPSRGCFLAHTGGGAPAGAGARRVCRRRP